MSERETSLRCVGLWRWNQLRHECMGLLPAILQPFQDDTTVLETLSL